MFNPSNSTDFAGAPFRLAHLCVAQSLHQSRMADTASVTLPIVALLFDPSREP
jgi:hypothetical protein